MNTGTGGLKLMGTLHYILFLKKGKAFSIFSNELMQHSRWNNMPLS